MRAAVVGVCGLLLLMGAAAGTVAASPAATASGDDRAVEPASLEQVSTNNSTVFKRIETEDAGMVIDVDASLLTNPLGENTALRLVSGGTANGERVVWVDVGVGYTGGPVLEDPLDGFVTRAEASLNLPFMDGPETVYNESSSAGNVTVPGNSSSAGNVTVPENQ